jgi:hypothetical protein
MILPACATLMAINSTGKARAIRCSLHRLEACKQLGEETIVGYVVQARRH